MLCKHCNTDKNVGEFYANNRTRCKECVKAAATANRMANIERVRAYDRMRGSMPHRLAANREHARTQEGKVAKKRACAAYRLRHKDRVRAHNAISKAILRGKLVPWPVCEVPECSAKPQAHHPHYGAPLLVTWLCDEHHKEVHAMAKEAA